MSSFQSPQLLTDLYRDLRDRRLLPLVLVLVVGLAVVPIALSSKSTSAPPASPPAPIAVAKRSKAPATDVVVSDPGLRDYHKRLSGDSPKDPFVQLFNTPKTNPAADAQSSGSADTSSAGQSTATVSPTETTGSTAPSGGSASQPQPQTQSKFYFYRVKVRSGQLGEELKVDDSVGSLDQLPSKSVPAVAFLGVTTNSAFEPKTAVFLVSSAVSSLDGEGTCTFAGTYCQLLSLKPGQHEDLVWTDGLVYRINLVKFDLIARNNPPSVEGQGSGGGSGGGGSAGRKAGRHGAEARHAGWQYFSF
jgi:hypothetical protein